MRWGLPSQRARRLDPIGDAMKWMAFVGALLAVYPFGLLLRRSPQLRLHLWTLVGLLPFVGLGIFFDINVLSYELYRGDSRGFEITVIDLLVLALYVALPKRRFDSPYRAARYLYLFAALLSVTQAPEPMFSWFSIWKLLRMYVFLAIVSRACQDARVPRALLKGMALGVLCQLPMVFYQRYLLGVHQTTGFFAHQNGLGTAVNIMVPILLALVLARSRQWLYPAALLAGAVTIVMSLSRGAMANFVFVSWLMFGLSVSRKLTPRKLFVALVCATLVGGILLKAGDTIVDRFLYAPRASGEGRQIFEAASAAMLADHPLGIGINQYSLVVTQHGYWDRSAADAGSTIPETGTYGGIVHNIYWLSASEMGYLGIFAFGWLLIGPLYLALGNGWRARHDLRGHVLLGLGTGLVGLYLHGFLEWTMRLTSISYLFWLVAALVAALAQEVHQPRASAVGAKRG